MYVLYRFNQHSANYLQTYRQDENKALFYLPRPFQNEIVVGDALPHGLSLFLQP